MTARGIRLAGHSERHHEPTHGWNQNRGRPILTCGCKEDAEAGSSSKLAGCMENWDDWKQQWGCKDDLERGRCSVVRTVSKTKSFIRNSKVQ